MYIIINTDYCFYYTLNYTLAMAELPDGGSTLAWKMATKIDALRGLPTHFSHGTNPVVN